MRRTALLPLLLLLGLLQAALAPAPPAPRADDRPGLRAIPGAPAQPAESAPAIKRPGDSPRPAGLAGEGKFQKGDLVAPPARMQGEDARAARFARAGRSATRRAHARPLQPRAPPALLPS